jgi:hypothetical protein
VPLVLAVVVVIAGVSWVHRMYRYDMATLARFMASYERVDSAITTGNRGESKSTLMRLRSVAHERISSLTKNDGTAMTTMREIADIAEREFGAGPAGRSCSDLTRRRKEAYARSQALGTTDATSYWAASSVALCSVYLIARAPG